jgi:hypothetical protein
MSQMTDGEILQAMKDRRDLWYACATGVLTQEQAALQEQEIINRIEAAAEPTLEELMSQLRVMGGGSDHDPQSDRWEMMAPNGVRVVVRDTDVKQLMIGGHVLVEPTSKPLTEDEKQDPSEQGDGPKSDAQADTSSSVGDSDAKPKKKRGRPRKKKVEKPSEPEPVITERFEGPSELGDGEGSDNAE